MRLELFNLGEPRLQPLDTFGGSVKVFSGPLRPRRQLVVVGQIVVDQEIECFCRLFQIEDFGPPLITELLKHVRAFPRFHFRVEAWDFYHNHTFLQTQYYVFIG